MRVRRHFLHSSLLNTHKMSSCLASTCSAAREWCVGITQETAPLGQTTQRSWLMRKQDVKVSLSVHIQILGCRSKFWQKRYSEVSMWNNSNFEGNHEIGIVSVLKGFFSQENLLISGLTCVISLFRAYFSCIVLQVFIKTSHSVILMQGFSFSPSAKVLTG